LPPTVWALPRDLAHRAVISLPKMGAVCHAPIPQNIVMSIKFTGEYTHGPRD
jgi:hypothetical protein